MKIIYESMNIFISHYQGWEAGIRQSWNWRNIKSNRKYYIISDDNTLEGL